MNGILTCNERAFVLRDMSLRQLRESILVARGFFGFTVSCTPRVVEQWSVEVDTETSMPSLRARRAEVVLEFATDNGFRDFIEDDSVQDEQVTLS